MQITTSALEKFNNALHLLKREGVVALAQRIYAYIKYRLYDQWKFVYFARSLAEPFPQIANQIPLTVWRADPNDLSRIEVELFPLIEKAMSNDQRYFSLLGLEGVHCFLGEKNGRMVHYSWLFTDLTHAPIMYTHFPKRKLKKGDVFIGPVFTDPQVRGAWIFPYVLSKVMEYAKQQISLKRAVLFVDGRNTGAVAFFKRFGFKMV